MVDTKTPMLPVQRPDGSLIPPGLVEHTLEWSALSGALPSWLQATYGTATFASIGAGEPALILTGDGSRRARLTATFPVTGLNVNISKLSGVWFEVYGVTEDPATLDHAFYRLVLGSREWPASAEGAFVQAATPSNAQGRTRLGVVGAGELDTAHSYLTWRASGQPWIVNHVHMGMMLNFQTRRMYAMEGDNVVAARSLPDPWAKTLDWSIFFQAAANNITGMKTLISGARLRLWYA